MRRVLPMLVLTGLLPGCGTFGLQATTPSGGRGWVDITPTGEVEFGESSPAAHSVRQEVTVAAGGAEAIVVTDAWIEGTTEGVFAFADAEVPFPRLLDPGDTIPLNIKFRPSAQGDFSGTLVVEIEDGSLIERALRGSGCADREDDGKCD